MADSKHALSKGRRGFMSPTASSRAKTPPPVRKEQEKESPMRVAEMKGTASWTRKKDKETVDTTWAARDFYPPAEPSIVKERLRKKKSKAAPPQKENTPEEAALEATPAPQHSTPQRSVRRSMTPKEKMLREAQWISPTDRHSPVRNVSTPVRDFEEWLQKKGKMTSDEWERGRLQREAELKAQMVIQKHTKEDQEERKRLQQRMQYEAENIERYCAVQSMRSPSPGRVSRASTGTAAVSPQLLRPPPSRVRLPISTNVSMSPPR